MTPILPTRLPGKPLGAVLNRCLSAMCRGMQRGDRYCALPRDSRVHRWQDGVGKIVIWKIWSTSRSIFSLTVGAGRIWVRSRTHDPQRNPCDCR